MKSKDLVLFLILGVLGYVVYTRFLNPAVPPSGPGANLSAGQLPAGTPNLATSIASAAQGLFNAIGSFAQNTPKTT